MGSVVYCPVCHSDYPADWKVCPKDTTSLLKAATIGKYAIDGLLGVGGMGAVYKARNPDTQGRVAVKVMNAAVAAAESGRARFQREAAAVAALRTVHVTKVYDFGSEPDGTLYLVMELLDGHPLRHEIKPAPEYMDLARVQMVMSGALKGLAAAHKAGIVHRDLKPDNIFVTETDDGEIPKLLDFGIARVKTSGSDLTRTGSLMGTASYMAPEQVAGDVGEVGPWTDVYAMGAILYEMLSGAPAVDGDTITGVLHRVLTSDIVKLQSVRSGIPQAVYDLVARCMAPEIKDRPQDAEAMRTAFVAAQLVPPGAAVPPPHKTKENKLSELAVAATESGDLVEKASKASGQQSRKDGATRDLGPSQVPIEPVAPTQPVHTPTSAPIPPPKKSLVVPLVGGLCAVGAVVAYVVVSNREPPAPPPPPDRPVVVVDAAVAPAPVADAAQVAVVVDAPADPNAGLIHFKAGKYKAGIPRGKVADALPVRDVPVREFWIDAHEMTIGELARALPDLDAAIRDKTLHDPPTLPARFVDWQTANAACQALGKRLPTEDEWEVAAMTTPNMLHGARLKRTNTDEDLSAESTDCSSDGLCEMLGGLREWTSSPWKGGARTVRGASYRVPPDPQVASIFARIGLPPATRDNEIGFRCAK